MKNSISFIVAAHIDCADRLDNLKITLNAIKRNFAGCELILVEADQNKTLNKYVKDDEYIFFKLKHDEVLNKMRLYNLGAKKASNSVLCFVDVDTPPSKTNILKAYDLLRTNTYDVVLPYKKSKGYNIPKHLHDKYTQDADVSSFNLEKHPWLSECDDMPYVDTGGIVLFNTSSYIHGGGGNENFQGWGCEDDEMISRFAGLGYRIGRVDDAIIVHLKHARGANPAWYDYTQYERANRARLAEVRNMNRDQLQTMTDSWNNFESLKNNFEDVTVIISSSYLESHPEITFIKEVIESLELTGISYNTPILLSHDKIKPATEGFDEKEKTYAKYFENLQEYVKTSKFKNIEIVLAPEWGHLTRTLKHAMSKVNTKYVFVLQHDIHIRREIPVQAMINLMEKHKHIKHLRFNVRKNLPTFMWWDGYTGGKTQFAEEEYDGVKLCVTPAWSDQNHLATKEYYETIVFPDCTNDDGELIYDFMENRLNGKCHHNHDRYGTYIYGEFGAPRTSRHSDGRKSSPEPDED